jgi:hypothetical protein
MDMRDTHILDIKDTLDKNIKDTQIMDRIDGEQGHQSRYNTCKKTH